MKDLFFCCRYTLLIGHPPFETKSLRETYNRIRNNEYTIPSRISDNAARLIKKMLQPNPNDRPSLNHVLEDDFFTKGFHPTRLPISSVTCSPKWSEYDKTGESDKKISKEAIKKITIALSRQMKLSSDDKEDSTEKDCRKEDNGDYLRKEVSTSGKDIFLSSEIDQSNPTPRDTGQEGRCGRLWDTERKQFLYARSLTRSQKCLLKPENFMCYCLVRVLVRR